METIGWHDSINSEVESIKNPREPELEFDPKKHRELGIMNDEEKRWFAYMLGCEEAFAIFEYQTSMRCCGPTALEKAKLEELRFRRVISFCTFWGDIKKRFNAWNEEELLPTQGWRIVIELQPPLEGLTEKIVESRAPVFSLN